jgi:Fibronectin type III domain
MSPRPTPTARVLRTLAGASAALLASALLPAPPAAAAPADDWAACADDAATSCIQDATLTPVGGTPTPIDELGLTASATLTTGDVTALNWAVDGWPEQAPDVLDGEITLTLRTGAYAPRFTTATAAGMRVTRTVDDAGDYTMTVTGRAAHVAWTTGEFAELCAGLQYCGEDDQMADEAGTGYHFAGVTQDLHEYGPDYVDAIDGAYLASDAQARTGLITYVSDPEPAVWLGVLGNPHLDAAGNPVRGSFNAWVPPGYFAMLGTTAQDAAAAGFDVVDAAPATPVSLPATATVRDGGVSLTASGIGYGMSLIQVYNRPSGAPDGATAPDAPQDVQATADAGTVTARWSAPDSDGGSPLTGYTVRAFTEATGGTVASRCTVDAPTDADSTGDALSCTLDNLTEDELYYIAVSATNAYGESAAQPERLTIAASAPQATPPSAPTALAVTPAAARLTATWDRPKDDNGAPVTGYTVRAFTSRTGWRPVATCTAAAPARRCALTRLVNGVTYYVAVTASNDAGEGPESEFRVAATPRTVPGAPRALSVSSSGGKVRAGWSAPAVTGGSPVTGYRVAAFAARSGGGAVGQCTGKASERTCTLSGLRAGRTYYVGATAVNAAGSSMETTRVRVLVRR